jgi:AraC-like DNA-binding protein
VHIIAYREFSPHYLLSDYIEVYWYFKIQTNTNQSFEIIPDGYFDLLILIQDNRIIGSRLTGLWCKSVTINYSADTEIVGLRFKPLASGHILNFQIKDLLNNSSTIELSDIGLNKQIIIDGLNGFPGVWVQYLDNHFLSLINPDKKDNRMQRLFSIIDKSSGVETIESISGIIGLSTRQIHRKLNDLIGVGTKDYSKIIRFKHALQNENALDGYFDQSHFIKDFKEFTGQNPSGFDLKKDVRFLQYHDFGSA